MIVSYIIACDFSTYNLQYQFFSIRKAQQFAALPLPRLGDCLLIIKRLVGSVAFKDGVPVFQNESGHHIDAPLKSNTAFIVSIFSISSLHLQLPCTYHEQGVLC